MAHSVKVSGEPTIKKYGRRKKPETDTTKEIPQNQENRQQEIEKYILDSLQFDVYPKKQTETNEVNHTSRKQNEKISNNNQVDLINNLVKQTHELMDQIRRFKEIQEACMKHIDQLTEEKEDSQEQCATVTKSLQNLIEKINQNTDYRGNFKIGNNNSEEMNTLRYENEELKFRVNSLQTRVSELLEPTQTEHRLADLVRELEWVKERDFPISAESKNRIRELELTISKMRLNFEAKEFSWTENYTKLQEENDYLEKQLQKQKEDHHHVPEQREIMALREENVELSGQLENFQRHSDELLQKLEWQRREIEQTEFLRRRLKEMTNQNHDLLKQVVLTQQNSLLRKKTTQTTQQPTVTSILFMVIVLGFVCFLGLLLIIHVLHAKLK